MNWHIVFQEKLKINSSCRNFGIKTTTMKNDFLTNYLVKQAQRRAATETAARKLIFYIHSVSNLMANVMTLQQFQHNLIMNTVFY